MLRRARIVRPIRPVEDRILAIRGRRVLLDRDLAELYDVPTKVLNQAVTRNRARFPNDFAFRLTPGEVANLKSQIVTSSSHGGQRKSPRVFTEQGVAMLSGVLRSRRAVLANVAIMRAFVRLREYALTHAELTRKLADLEKKYDGRFAVVFNAIRELAGDAQRTEIPRPRIGFTLPAASHSRSATRLRPARGR